MWRQKKKKKKMKKREIDSLKCGEFKCDMKNVEKGMHILFTGNGKVEEKKKAFFLYLF